MNQIGLYWPLKWPSWFFSKNAHFGCYIGFIGPFKTHFTLAQFWFWAFFLDFFSKKPTSDAHLTNFFLAPFKKRLIKITFDIFFQMSRGSKVMVSNFSFLKCSFLIGRGSDFQSQCIPVTMMSLAFRNGMTLKNWPKNEAVRANSQFWWYF